MKLFETIKSRIRIKAAKLSKRIAEIASLSVRSERAMAALEHSHGEMFRSITETETVELSANCTASCVIFSKDRPLQCWALLESISLEFKTPPRIYLLFRGDIQDYEEIGALSAQAGLTCEMIQEVNFRDQLREILAKIQTSWTFFLVDDIVFTEPVDLTRLCCFDPYFFVPTLRMGLNLVRNYPSGGAPQRQPVFSDDHLDRELVRWSWAGADGDWGYPLSVDGNLFATAEIRAMAGASSYAAPNSFEFSLQAFSHIFNRREGVCFRKSRLVNIPNNLVQNEFHNRSAGGGATELLHAWRSGQKIDISPMSGLVNVSAHQNIGFRMIPRQPNQDRK